MLNRIAALAITALACALPARAQPVDKAEMQAVIAKADEELNQRYIFPDRAAEAGAKIKAALAAGDYDAITDPKAFADRLTADLQAVTHDKHMRVVLPALLDAPAASIAVRTNTGFAAVERLKGNIGYIDLRGFPPLEAFKPAANRAMADLAGTKALIIDLRSNGGGDPGAVAYLCSFFFDPRKPVHVNSLVFRKPGTKTYTAEKFLTVPVPTSYRDKPVYLLTSGATFSGAEEFAYDLQTRGRAILIGATTGGGANPGGGRPLNPRFGMFISTGRAENPLTKTNWEGAGVAPDVIVRPSQALRLAMLKITGDAQFQEERTLQAAALSEAHLLKFREAPQPGSAAALARHLTRLARGKPDYNMLVKVMAGRTRENLADIQAELAPLGDIQSTLFKRVGPDGLDVYEVGYANGALLAGIFLTPGGKIGANWFHPLKR